MNHRPVSFSVCLAQVWCAQPRPRHHGVALLLVLAVLVLTIPVAVVLARQAGNNRLAYSTLQAVEFSAALRATFEADFIRTWLLEESANTVLPPTSKIPALNILDEEWRMDFAPANGPVDWRIRITAFDQAGMVPLEHAHAGAPLRRAIPAEILAQLERHDNRQKSYSTGNGARNPGLDQFYPTTVFNRPPTNSNWQSPFPSHDLKRAEAALGAYLATHNTTEMDLNTTSRQLIPVKINVNTAPLPLLEAALRALGRGGIEAISAARAQNKSAVGKALPPLRAENQPHNSQQITLTGTSTSWAFRIEIEAAGVQRSWWCVYQKQSAQQYRENSNPWECVQRLAINY